MERAAISLRREGRLTTLTVDRRIRVEGTANEGPSGRPMALNDGKLSNVLGSPATVGESGRFRVGLSALGMDLDLRGRSTMSGRFSYKHVPDGARQVAQVVTADRRGESMCAARSLTVESQGSEDGVTLKATTTKPEVRDAPYQLAGSFYEACDCFPSARAGPGATRTRASARAFSPGRSRKDRSTASTSGLRAVSVSHHTGFRSEARQRVVIFVDESATQQQSDALVAAFTGSLGGPLEELADLLGELLAVEHAPITLRREGRLTTLTVGKRILVEGTTSEGPSATPHDAQRWKVERRAGITGGGGRELALAGRTVGPRDGFGRTRPQHDERALLVRACAGLDLASSAHSHGPRETFDHRSWPSR